MTWAFKVFFTHHLFNSSLIYISFLKPRINVAWPSDWHLFSSFSFVWGTSNIRFEPFLSSARYQIIQIRGNSYANYLHDRRAFMYMKQSNLYDPGLCLAWWAQLMPCNASENTFLTMLHTLQSRQWTQWSQYPCKGATFSPRRNDLSGSAYTCDKFVCTGIMLFHK